MGAVLLLEACATDRPSYDLRDLSAPAPALPASCGEGVRCTGDTTWVVFYSAYCGSCHDLLRDFSAQSGRLSREGVCVKTYLVDAEGCPDAQLVSHRTGSWPVAPAGPLTLAAWHVDTSPVVYVVKNGQVTARLQGRAPLDALLAR